MLSTVPPQPISRSSQCAPRHRTRSMGRSNWSNRTLSMRAPGPPDLPRRIAPGLHVVEPLLILEGIHAGPEAGVPVGQQLLLPNEVAKRLLDEFLAGLYRIENGPLEDEEAPVDPQPRVLSVPDVVNQPGIVDVDDVERVGGPHGQKARGHVVATEVIEIRRQVQIGEAVGVVGHEHVVVVTQEALHGLQALPEVRVQAGVDERDPPVLDVATEDLDVLATLREHEVVGQTLVVVQEVLLDRVTAKAEAENEVVVPEVRIILHQMPDDRPVADVHHRLGDRLRVLPEPGAQTTAEEHELHRLLRSVSGPAWRYQSRVRLRRRSSGVVARRPRPDAVVSTSATRVRVSGRPACAPYDGAIEGSTRCTSRSITSRTDTAMPVPRSNVRPSMPGRVAAVR